MKATGAASSQSASQIKTPAAVETAGADRESKVSLGLGLSLFVEPFVPMKMMVNQETIEHVETYQSQRPGPVEWSAG
jgi:hypothetical protein